MSLCYNNNGQWIDTSHLYSTKQNEVDSAKGKIDNSTEDLRNKIIMFQGLVLELQRRAGKAEKFDSGLYGETTKIEKHLEDLMTQIKILTEQVEYTKDIVDAVKVSQELSDGFEKPKEYKFGIDIAKLGNATTVRALGSTDPKSYIVPTINTTLTDYDKIFSELGVPEKLINK